MKISSRKNTRRCDDHVTLVHEIQGIYVTGKYCTILTILYEDIVSIGLYDTCDHPRYLKINSSQHVLEQTFFHSTIHVFESKEFYPSYFREGH